MRFHEEISDFVEDLNGRESPLHNEGEWAILMDGPNADDVPNTDVDMVVSSIQEELVDVPVSQEYDSEVPSSSGIGRKRLNSTSENEVLPVVRKKKSRQVIEEESSDEDENSEVCEVVPMGRRYYVICLRSKKKVEHYIGLSDFSGNQADKYWMQFFRKTKEPGKFKIKDDDSGLVSLDEIVKELDNPLDDLTSSSRCGKLLLT